MQKADIARYLILHRDGGIYADIDTECVGPLDILTTESRVIFSQEPTEHWGHAEVRNMDMVVFNGVMASPAGHPFWLDVMQMLHRCRHANKGVLESTGPLMLTGCVAEYPPDVLSRLLAEQQKIVVPNCVRTPGGTSYDLNSFLDLGTPRNHIYYLYAKGGLFQPPKSFYWRSHFDDLRFLQRTPLTEVGGTMLLVHGSVHRAGINFPEIPYDDLLETEGFGKMAVDFGLTPLGLPNLEIIHVKG